MSRLLAIDPGERVGWAHGLSYPARVVVDPDNPSNEAEIGPSLEITGHGITPLKPFALKLAEVMPSYDEVIYETWRLTPHGAKVSIGSDMQSSQLIGMIRLLAWQHPQIKLVSQGPNVMNVARETIPGDIRDIIATAPKAHDDSHDVSALLHLHYRWWKTNVARK